MKIAGYIMWLVGFVMAAAFLSLANHISSEAFWYAAGAELGGVTFTCGIFIKGLK